MSKLEIGLWWFGGMIFVLGVTAIITHFTDRAKPVLKGVQPRVEVYKRDKKRKYRRSA